MGVPLVPFLVAVAVGLVLIFLLLRPDIP